MTPTLLVDLALAPLAGYLGTKAMEPIGTWLYERESQADRDREEAVRPGPPHRIAAQKSTALIGLDLSKPALDRAALAFHYGLAVSWAPPTRCCAATPASAPSPPGSHRAPR